MGLNSLDQDSDTSVTSLKGRQWSNPFSKRDGKKNKKKRRSIFERIRRESISSVVGNPMLTDSDEQEECGFAGRRRGSLVDMIMKMASTNKNDNAAYLANELRKLREKTKTVVKSSWAEVEKLEVEKCN